MSAATCLRNVASFVSVPNRCNSAFEFLQAFDQGLWSKWNGYERMVKYTQNPVDKVFRAFLLGEYYATMADALEQMGSAHSRSLQPAFPVTAGDATAEEQEARLALLSGADDADGAAVDEILRSEFAQMLSGLGPEMKSILPASCEAAFREKRYFSVLSEVVSKHQRTNDAVSHAGMAQVQPEEGCDDQQEVGRRRQLLKLLTPSMFLSVQKEVHSQWSAEIEAQPPSLRSFLPVEPPQNFWMVHYYPAIEAIVAKIRPDVGATPALSRCDSPAALSSRPAGVGTGAAQANNSTLFASAAMLGMQAIMDDMAHEQQAAVNLGAVEMQLLGSRSLLSEEAITLRVCYQGKVVYYDPQPRDTTPREPSQSPRKRRLSDDMEANVACDLLPADNTGPVLVTLWGQCCQHMVRDGGRRFQAFCQPGGYEGGASFERRELYASICMTALVSECGCRPCK